MFRLGSVLLCCLFPCVVLGDVQSARALFDDFNWGAFYWHEFAELRNKIQHANIDALAPGMAVFAKEIKAQNCTKAYAAVQSPAKEPLLLWVKALFLKCLFDSSKIPKALPEALPMWKPMLFSAPSFGMGKIKKEHPLHLKTKWLSAVAVKFVKTQYKDQPQEAKDILQTLVKKSLWVNNVQASRVYVAWSDWYLLNNDKPQAIESLKHAYDLNPTYAIEQKKQSLLTAKGPYAELKSDMSEWSLLYKDFKTEWRKKNKRSFSLCAKLQERPQHLYARRCKASVRRRFFISARRGVLKPETLDKAWVVDLAEALFAAENYAGVLRLLDGAEFKGSKNSSTASGLWFIKGQSLLYLGHYEKAEQAFLKSQTQEAWFFAMLVGFRLKNYKLAADYAQRYLTADSKLRLQAMHWLWRAHQQMGNKTRARARAQDILQKYPLSFYGLKARKFLNGTVECAQKNTWGTYRVELDPEQTRALRAFLVLSRVGLAKEALMPLEFLGQLVSGFSLLFLSRVYAEVDTLQSMALGAAAIENNPQFFSREVLEVIFPRKYMPHIEAESKKWGLDANLVLGLIRQESAFNPRARSTAGARGLMQVLPGTAREMRRYLRAYRKLPLPSGLYRPRANIAIGTYYLKRWLKVFGGHVPITLASYNVGPGNLRKWLKKRQDTDQLWVRKSANYLDDLWVDELPWAETRYYVQAVLRNFMVYKCLAD